MAVPLTATIRRDNGWWIGWINEMRGVNSQGESVEELMENLYSALNDLLSLPPT